MSLSSLIVQREIATIRQVEEALARQVLYGGDLVTNLLEVAVVDEAKLNDAAAEAASILPAPAGVLPDPDPRARALIPGDLAVRRSLYPLRMNADAEQLLVAVAEPLSAREEEELMFALGVPLEQRLAPFVRVRQALARIYGAPLERRLERLAMRLAGEPTRVSQSHPPLLGEPPPGRAPPRPESTPPGRVATSSFPSHRSTNIGFPIPEPPTVPHTPILSLEGVPSSEAEPGDVEGPREVTPTDPMSLPPVVPIDAHRETLLRQLSAPPRRVRRRRGPMTLDKARAELDDVDSRDGLLDLFFDFARQYFEYSALFVVHGDVAEGRDAYGPGASREKVLGIGVPLDLPCILSGARATSGPILRAPDRDGLDAVLLNDLGRKVQSAVLALPVVVRGRAVAILYGDVADAGVDIATVGDVVAFAALAGQAFERLILKKKLGGFSGGPPGSSAGRATLTEQVAQTLAATASSKRAGAGSGERVPVVEAARGAEVLGRALLGDAADTQREGERRHGTPSPASGSATRAASAPASAPPHATPAASEPPPATAPGEAAPPTANEPTFSIPRRRPASPLPPPASVAAVRRPAGPPIPREEPEDPTRRAPERVAYPRDVAPDSAPPLPLVGVDGAARSSRPRASHPVPSAESPATTRNPTPVPPTLVDAPGTSPPAPEVTSQDLDDEAARSLLSEIEAAQEAMDEPPPSQSIAVPPHRPPASRTDGAALPSVIVDVARELDVLLDRFLANVDDEQAEAELIRQGQYAMHAIVARFPGPILVQPRLDEEDSPPVSTCGPLLRLIVLQRRVAVSAVLPLLDDPNEEVRFWATFVVTELAYPEIIGALVPRFNDSSERVTRVARLAAAAIARTYGDEVAREIGRTVRDTSAERARRLGMLGVLEDIRCAFAVPTFIAVLSDQDEEVAAAGQKALAVVTRQDFARDAKRWTTWWNQNSSRHRVEWLIDALVHEAQPMRRAAGEELKALTKEYFGYYDDLPKRERERAQARYREWWRTEGYLRFVR